MEEQSLSQLLSPSLLEFAKSSDAKDVGVAISELEFDEWLANLPDLSAVEAVNSDSGVTPTGTEALLHSTDLNFVVTSTSELKRLQELNYNKNTMKSGTVTWLNRRFAG